ncbi:3-ketoacyl-CoA thiolase, mitochondrial-like [Oscarella lobularis]|uniref:3-ketoacyl-CoA thiolase, mitochondrial-like n=1 Tax=Oscarella lobularis TaxID=121494 RepID=UPI0033131FBD
MATRRVFVVAAKRTPFGAFGGLLKNVTETDLGVHAAKAALAAGKVPLEAVSSVIFGNVIQSSSNAAYLARHVGLKCGLPVEVNALSINRLCGTGFQAIISGAHEIALGESDVVLTGATENMSMAPFATFTSRFGVRLGHDMKLVDVLWAGLRDSYVDMPMGVTAENLAERYKISREDCDLYALQSQTRWKEANDAGRFEAEMAPIELKKKTMTTDEHPRPATNIESLRALPTVFSKTGTVTAGNASGICDGAGSVILASEASIERHGLQPLARVVAYHVSGVDPTIMGIGPAPAIRGVLEKAGLSLDDISLVDINEAFAPQYLAVEKELGLDREKTNCNGGAIALGHPLAASGSRISAHLVHQLQRTQGRYAIGSACIGGGQGIAVLFEKC